MSPFWTALIAVAALALLATLALAALLWRRRAALRESEMGRLARRVIALPLRRKARLAWRMFTDHRVPLLARAALPTLVLYLAMPLDIVPDFIPVLGYLDDVLIVLGAAWLLLRLIPAGVLEEQVAALEREERT